MSRTCSVDGCQRAHHARGVCRTHYQRLLKTGTLDKSEAIRRRTEASARRREEVARQRIEDLTWLADNGVGLTEAAHRIGMKRNSLETWLSRRGEKDLMHRLIARDWLPVGERGVNQWGDWRSAS